jgi:hypothetical protein
LRADQCGARTAFLVLDGRLLRCSAKGYLGVPEPAGEADLITPLATVATLAAGYQYQDYARGRELAPDELETGFRRLEQAVAADPGQPVPDGDATVLTLER